MLYRFGLLDQESLAQMPGDGALCTAVVPEVPCAKVPCAVGTASAGTSADRPADPRSHR